VKSSVASTLVVAVGVEATVGDGGNVTDASGVRVAGWHGTSSRVIPTGISQKVEKSLGQSKLSLPLGENIESFYG
jgi:hypothetical protein